MSVMLKAKTAGCRGLGSAAREFVCSAGFSPYWLLRTRIRAKARTTNKRCALPRRLRLRPRGTVIGIRRGHLRVDVVSPIGEPLAQLLRLDGQLGGPVGLLAGVV